MLLSWKVGIKIIKILTNKIKFVINKLNLTKRPQKSRVDPMFVVNDALKKNK